MCVCVCVFTYTYIYIYIYIHTHIYTHSCTQFLSHNSYYTYMFFNTLNVM